MTEAASEWTRDAEIDESEYRSEMRAEQAREPSMEYAA